MFLTGTNFPDILRDNKNDPPIQSNPPRGTFRLFVRVEVNNMMRERPREIAIELIHRSGTEVTTRDRQRNRNRYSVT